MSDITLFFDVDGVILHQREQFFDKEGSLGEVIESTRDAIFELWKMGYRIILTTGRPESHRKMLENHLVENNVFFTKLVLDCGSGSRYIINDMDGETQKAFAVNVERNKGIRIEDGTIQWN